MHVAVRLLLKGSCVGRVFLQDHLESYFFETTGLLRDKLGDNALIAVLPRQQRPFYDILLRECGNECE